MYNELKKILKEFNKNLYWSTFSITDLFYFITSEKEERLVSFTDSFFGMSNAVQIFFNADGFNYIHDLFTLNDPETLSIANDDSICLAFVKKEDLAPNEIAYIRSKGSNIYKENNLIIYRFKKGFGQTFANEDEEFLALKTLLFINVLISRNYIDVISAFETKKSVVAFLNEENKTYSVYYRDLPYLEKLPKRKKANMEFVNEFKDNIYLNDECYIFTSYLPLVISQTNVRPLLVYFYYENTEKIYLKYILDKPKEYAKCIYGILDEVFTNVGMPYKIYFNSRDFYFILNKTLNALNIENVLIGNNKYVDGSVGEVIERVFEEVPDEVYEEEDVVSILVDVFTTVINDIQSDPEKEKKITYVS